MAGIKCLSFFNSEPDTVSYYKNLIEHQSAIIIEGWQKWMFFIALDEIGENQEANTFLRNQMKKFQSGESPIFNHAIAGLVVVSNSELYTKTYAKKFIFLANQMGCEFIGHPLVERVKERQNFKTWAKVIDKQLDEIEQIQIEKLIERLSNYTFISKSELSVLVLHAGHKEISNTLMYWDFIKSNLPNEDLNVIKIEELHVEEGKITDCYGCGFETCTYYSLEKSCFYGGFVVSSLFPMIEKADIVVWICPNYNDAISAKLMAVINRLTALYRKITFNDKYILSIVVSGNSGNDTVTGQLIGALNINKGFRLPPFFAAMAIANDPGDIKSVLEGDERAFNYVNNVHNLTNKIVTKN